MLPLSLAMYALVYSVRDYGAKGDRKTDDTVAFVEAITAVATAGAGTVLVPTGGDYLIRPINLTSHMELLIQKGASILGLPDHTRWPLIQPAPSYGQGRDHPGMRYTSLLHGERLLNVTIRGEGGGRSFVDGQGSYWWDRHLRGDERYTRGHLVEFISSSDVAVLDVALVNSPFWTTHFLECDRVHVRGVDVYAPDGAPNTDGYDPDSSSNVLIEDSTYHGGDDCVAIKSGWDCFGVWRGRPCVNITIRNLTCDGNIAGVAIGSEVSGGVSNVTVANVTFKRANDAAHIKTSSSRGGYVTNVRFADLKVVGRVQRGVHVRAAYGSRNPSCPKNWRPPAATILSNYTFERIDAMSAEVSASSIELVGSDESFIAAAVFHDVRIAPGKLGKWTCGNVSGTAESVDPWPPCAGINEIQRGRAGARHVPLAVVH